MARKGSTGPTAGRKAETVRSPSTGKRLRVMFGQRWLVVQPTEDGQWITSWVTEEDANYHRDRVGGSAYVEQAEVVSA